MSILFTLNFVERYGKVLPKHFNFKCSLEEDFEKENSEYVFDTDIEFDNLPEIKNKYDLIDFLFYTEEDAWSMYYPKFEFIKENYDKGLRSLIPFDFKNSPIVKNRKRRDDILEKIKWNVQPDTESKRTRKALINIIEQLQTKGLIDGNIKVIQDFLFMSNTIEKAISSFPKE